MEPGDARATAREAAVGCGGGAHRSRTDRACTLAARLEPRQRRANIGLAASGAPSCCTTDQQFWTLSFSAHFGFFDQSRSICTAPGVELSGEMLKEIQLGFVIGEHCSTGQLSLVNPATEGTLGCVSVTTRAVSRAGT